MSGVYHHTHQGPYSPPGYAPTPGDYPSAVPPPPGFFTDGFPPPPPPPGPPGYQGYFRDDYPPPPPQHIYHQSWDNYQGDAFCSSCLRSCLAILCCCWIWDRCCWY
ncbi:cysteine-rich and transmembrane domain-containing protein WIH1-like [Coffea eugenioides]|uniref:cysteine-rich and transmembrane domain-containing protein WIH1-like n=1 Tax=Coffea eugenioides TaxID=49369 RepID=UPI000F60BAC3|nr:cysteine-rich and transmembrane domain-containing protein WIH1-like [Coffea eugenioides]